MTDDQIQLAYRRVGVGNHRDACLTAEQLVALATGAASRSERRRAR